MSVVAGLIVPGMPQPLLAPDQNPGWAALRTAFDRARQKIEAIEADLLVLYSTSWPSVIGHQIQADPEPRWVHVDQEWHELGSIPYHLRMDRDYALAYEAAAQARGLHTRTVSYHGFPVDTGTIVALSLLNPGNRLPATVVSCNMYADRAETVVLGKAAKDALQTQGKRAVAVAITALSNRMHTRPIDPRADSVSSLKDDEWNRKLLEILGEGRLEDTSQLMRTFAAQAHADSKGRAIWWLAALMGEHNRYSGEVLEYKPIWGTGAAVVLLTPSSKAAADHEFDEESVEFFGGERSVLGGEALEERRALPPQAPAAPKAAPAPAPKAAPAPAPKPAAREGVIHASQAPRPVGAYAHARRVGDLLFLAGVGPRDPATDSIPGGPVRDADGQALSYDVESQTRATIDNVKRILEAAGATLDDVIDVTAFLIDMDRDFPTFNRVYAEYFGRVGATRTTLAVSALPTPIAVELKVVAKAPPA